MCAATLTVPLTIPPRIAPLPPQHTATNPTIVGLPILLFVTLTPNHANPPAPPLTCHQLSFLLHQHSHTIISTSSNFLSISTSPCNFVVSHLVHPTSLREYKPASSQLAADLRPRWTSATTAEASLTFPNRRQGHAAVTSINCKALMLFEISSGQTQTQT